MIKFMNSCDELNNFLNLASKSELSNFLEYVYNRASVLEMEALSSFSKIYKEKYYNNDIYLRALLEFTSYCKNDCYYCGLQCSNKKATRYRLSKDEILECCKQGHELGFRTFVLQGGEDLYYSVNDICDIVYSIKELYPDSAVTLSIGEKDKDIYKQYFSAGADRYLLRHETANNEHYSKLHPSNLSLDNRKKCLYNLKEIGFQVGAGFMVDSPFQTFDTIAEDLIFLRELQPHMIGIGPFIPHCDTKFKDFCKPTTKHTLALLSIVRTMIPKALIPATTALGTIDINSQDMALKTSANVIMPNLSPASHKKDYSIYDNKLCTSYESADNIRSLEEKLLNMNLKANLSRGDHIDFQKRSN